MNAELLALEQLGERDMRFIVSTLVPDPADRLRVARLARSEPKALEAMLADERLARRVTADNDILLRISPYLFFAVLLRQVRRDLEQTGYTQEWSSPRSRVPVFDAAVLAGLLTSLEMRHYLAEMLASFVRIEPPTELEEPGQDPDGLFKDWTANQLDVEALIRLGAESPHAQRLAVFRRVGDVALLLTGVFPDYTGRRRWVQPRTSARFRYLGRPSGQPGRGQPQPLLGPAEEIEEIGRRYYRMAARHPNAGWLGWEKMLNQLAEEFAGVRKVLNVLSDLYIHRMRCSWFPGAELP